MLQRSWAVRKAEKVILAACGTFWFQSCIHDGEAAPMYGVNVVPNSSSSATDTAQSSSVELSSSSSMDVGPMPLYGVFYSSTDVGSSSSTDTVSSSSLQASSSSELGVSSPVYGVSQPIEQSSSSFHEVIALYGIPMATSSSNSKTSSSN